MAEQKDKKMKILNLYAGIGGNRKLWPNEHEITAVEMNPEIAKIYKDFFHNDNVIVGDAHEYLLNHFQEFDFIWASPPCQSHSKFNLLNESQNKKQKYPDMKLYQEILLLQNFYKGFYVIENVIPYYEPLIKPTIKLHRHLFWSNFYIYLFDKKDSAYPIRSLLNKRAKLRYGFDIKDYKIKNINQILNNLVNPELGLHIFNCIPGNKNKNIQQNNLFDFSSCGTDAAQIK